MVRIATVFSGIGAVEQALKILDIEHEIEFACDNGGIEIDYDFDHEIKKVKELDDEVEKRDYVENLYRSANRRTNFVEQSYKANYEIKNNMFFQDIRLLDGTDFKNKVDLFVGGSPCQSFSTVGAQKGLEDARGTLFYEYARLVDEIKPKVFIYENVRGMYTHDKGNTWEIISNVFESLGYRIVDNSLYNSKEFGLPQNRTRIFVVGIRDDNIQYKEPSKIDLKYTMKDLLHDKCSKVYYENGNLIAKQGKNKYDEKYFLSEKLEAYVMSSGTKTFYQKPEIDLEVARPVLSTMGNRHRAGIDNYVTVKGKIRMLTEREAHRLMGFPDDYKIVVSRAQGYKQAGNSIAVPVLINILKGFRWE